MNNTTSTQRNFAATTCINAYANAFKPAPAGTVRVTFTDHLEWGYRGYSAILTDSELVLELSESERKGNNEAGRYKVYGFVMMQDGSICVHCENGIKFHAKVVITPDVILSLLPAGLSGDISYVDGCWVR